MDSKALRNQIKILSTKFIKPSSFFDHPKNYKLSFFDQFVCQMHVPCFLFYPPNKSTFSEISINIHERLEQSLSKLLTHVYPAAGRFSTDGQSINCHDEGVLYIKAKVLDCQFDDFLKAAQKDIDLALIFCPKIDRDHTPNLSTTSTPLVVAQVTQFDCGGLALSVSTEHTVIDGFTALKFVYEWSKLSKMGISVDKINCFTFDDFGTIFPGASDDNRHLWKIVRPPKLDHHDSVETIIARRFLINESAISRLRESVFEVCFRPSRVEIVISLFWRALINVARIKNSGRLRPSLLSVPMNLRGKIDFPRYENSFGNFVIDVPVKFIPTGETGIIIELQDIIILLRDVIQKTSVSFAKASDDDNHNIYFMAKKFHDEIQEWEENEQVDVCMASSLCRFPINETDFGWGKPCLATFGLRRSDMFWLYDTQCGGKNGIVVQADLKKGYMDMFQCDQDVLAFTCE